MEIADDMSTGGTYRYSYNGMEKDNEVSPTGVTGADYTTEFRELDTRLGGRWWSPDPVVKPWESPYAGFANNPIAFADPSGLDPVNEGKQLGGGGEAPTSFFGNGSSSMEMQDQGTNAPGKKDDGNKNSEDKKKSGPILPAANTNKPVSNDVPVTKFKKTTQTVVCEAKRERVMEPMPFLEFWARVAGSDLNVELDRTIRIPKSFHKKGPNGGTFVDGIWDVDEDGYATGEGRDGTINQAEMGVPLKNLAIKAGKLALKKLNPSKLQKEIKKLPSQIHHFATNKNQKYTPELKKIADEFSLDLDGSWNKQLLPHLGRHPDKYHNFVLREMTRASEGANGSQFEFLRLFDDYVKKPVIDNPGLLRKSGWGK